MTLSFFDVDTYYIVTDLVKDDFIHSVNFTGIKKIIEKQSG